MTETEQLAALARIDELFREHGIEYWLFGGWAVDFHAGSVTRAHHDLDLAVWLNDYPRIAAYGCQARGGAAFMRERRACAGRLRAAR